MKKFFLGICVLACLFSTVGCGNKAEKESAPPAAQSTQSSTQSTQSKESTQAVAPAEPAFNKKASDVLEVLKTLAEKEEFNLSEPKFTTSDNKKYCTINLGGSEDNKLVLKLNNDDTVVDAEISVPNSGDPATEGMAVYSMIGTLVGVGFNPDNLDQFLDSYYAATEAEASKQSNIIETNISAYCDDIKKDLNVNTKIDDKTIKIFIDIAK